MQLLFNEGETIVIKKLSAIQDNFFTQNYADAKENFLLQTPGNKLISDTSLAKFSSVLIIFCRNVQQHFR